MKHRKEVSDTIYLTALQGLNYIAPLIVFPYLMKTLGAEKFGYISFSLAVTQYLMLIIDFGFNLSATKRIALAKGNQQELNKVFTATVLSKIFLLIVSFVLLIAIESIPRFSIYRITTFIMFLMVIGNTFSFVWLFQGLGNIRIASIINTVAKLSILPLVFLFVKKQEDYLSAAFIQSLVFIISTLITILFIYKNKWVSFVKTSRNEILNEMKESFPLFISIAATSIYTSSFVVVLGYFTTPMEVGKYAAVDKLMRALCYLIFIPVSQAFYPKISRLAQENKAQAVKLTIRIFFAVGLSMIFLLLGMFFGGPLATKFLGNDYNGSEILCRILAFVPLFVATGGVAGQLVLLAIGNKADKKYFQRVYLFAGCVALISIFILIPLWSSTGAAISLLLTEFVVSFLMCWRAVKVYLLPSKALILD